MAAIWRVARSVHSSYGRYLRSSLLLTGTSSLHVEVQQTAMSSATASSHPIRLGPSLDNGASPQGGPSLVSVKCEWEEQ